MGRWTPLILMAGGLAILLGTLLGINFPMDGRNAEVSTSTRRKESLVLPANINVNSTATGSSVENSDRNNVAQNNNNNNRRTVQSAPTTAQGSTSTDSTTPSSSTNRRRTGDNVPIRALW